ncbi:hypothetical protein N7564_02695 [Acinetobacter johnsonii]|uniref:DUF968 domain-containing protein n=1 Tax=Acinetobacter johnsonii TaxID=40214 RepID=A0AAW6RMA4_ACIJO|nr:hypothetical protein [Acinetobacter johnsonii]MDG9785875.1 hypothetical protein [Acinetobacter johnsonii]MDG9797866.1 hypothetical protein [Acinetobacter johnsonii]
MRSPKRLAEIRKLPCVRCGNHPPSEACHANWAEFGKSMAKKASDEYTVALCRNCHRRMDGYEKLTREEAKFEFERYLKKTNLLLNFKDLYSIF